MRDSGNAGLSDDELMTAALKAMKDAAPARSALVEAIKQKVAGGEIGTDSARLADRIEAPPLLVALAFSCLIVRN